MTMSSFLMNSGPYVDPKFPPPEEYSQNSYIPPQSDYYNPAQHYPYHGMHQAGMQYGREAMQYNHAGYYQQACVMPQHQPMAAHISPQLPPCHSPLQQHQVPPRSPVASPDPSATATGAGGGMGAQMAQHMGGGGVEGSPEETVTELDANGQPVIYPWMKKIHVAGSGKVTASAIRPCMCGVQCPPHVLPLLHTPLTLNATSKFSPRCHLNINKHLTVAKNNPLVCYHCIDTAIINEPEVS